jgi:nitroreductase
MASYQEDDIKAALSLPESASVVAITPLGYADEAPEQRARKPAAELVEIL